MDTNEDDWAWLALPGPGGSRWTAISLNRSGNGDADELKCSVVATPSLCPLRAPPVRPSVCAPCVRLYGHSGRVAPALTRG